MTRKQPLELRPHCIALNSLSFPISVCQFFLEKLSKLFPLTNFSGILNSRPQCPACQLLPTCQAFLTIFTSGAPVPQAVSVLRNQLAKRLPAQVHTSSDPKHLLHVDLPDCSRGSYHGNHLEDFSQEQEMPCHPTWPPRVTGAPMCVSALLSTPIDYIGYLTTYLGLSPGDSFLFFGLSNLFLPPFDPDL